jgi:hypothetical protein
MLTIALTSDMLTLGNMAYRAFWNSERLYSRDNNDSLTSSRIDGWSRKIGHFSSDSAEERWPDDRTALSVRSLDVLTLG